MPHFEQHWFHSHGALSQEGVKNYMPAWLPFRRLSTPMESIMKLHTLPSHLVYVDDNTVLVLRASYS